jgi:hypothetical protein
MMEQTAPPGSPEPEAYDSYDYAILRVVPRVERGEFVNVGVLVSCPTRRFLEARVEVDEARLRALDASVDVEAARAHLESVRRICAGGKDAGPIGQLTQRERFHWLAAPKSALIQTSAVHTGRCRDPELLIERLMDLMVRPRRGE